MDFESRNCGHCKGIGTVSKTISNNSLTCTCRTCNKHYSLSLLKLKKKLIYLDQNFLSEAFKKNLPAFVNRANRLKDLSHKQLIICPYSEAHDKETHLCKGKEKELWDFIRDTSHGEQFKLQSQIETQQLVNAYVSFCNNKPDKSVLHLPDAISPSIHDWHDSLRVDINWSVTQLIEPRTLKQSKEHFIQSIKQALPQWRNSKSSLDGDYRLEVKDHARFLLKNYLDLKKTNDIEKILESTDYRLMTLLLELDIGGKNPGDRHKNVIEFLRSPHFANTPYINISAGLWALLKQKIKKNQFSTKIKHFTGIPADIDHLSIFAPYCDAIFTEKTMAQLLTTWCKHPLGNHSLKVFSAQNWEEFDAYLDEIENNISSEMKEELEIVYG